MSVEAQLGIQRTEVNALKTCFTDLQDRHTALRLSIRGLTTTTGQLRNQVAEQKRRIAHLENVITAIETTLKVHLESKRSADMDEVLSDLLQAVASKG